MQSSFSQRTTARYKSRTRLLDAADVAKNQRRKLSDPDIQHVNEVAQRSQPINIPAAATSPVVSPHIEGKICLKYSTIT